MHTDPQIRHLFELIPDPRIFRRWCDRAGVSSLEGFVTKDLSGAPEPWCRSWSQVQAALIEADKVSRTHGLTRGCATLDRMLRRAPAQVCADVSLLRKLTPIIPVQVVDPSIPMSAREALERLGGVAGARAVSVLLTEKLGKSVTVRQVRDRFRNTGGKVRKLGAGYFATQTFLGPPVLHWVESRISQYGPEKIDDLVTAILSAYPHGDRRAIRAWIHQQPGVLSTRGKVVTIVDARLSLVRHA
ncbi:MAG: hypothetical protein CL927_06495 [Deltaproteobacteria bacterium]|nr:hypothetical protein [Deltaproteobacteria bacterium]HCH63924.1 hypothetical protein [Deltaproteobacteria bacterium]